MVCRASREGALMSYIRCYEKHGKTQFLFSVPHLECNVWLCHMLSRADQLWLSQYTLSLWKRPNFTFQKIRGQRTKPSWGEDKKKKNGVASAVGKPRRFTLVLQCLHGLPQEASPCPIRQPQRELSDGMFTQGPQRQSLFKLAAGEGGLTWTLNAVQIQNRKLPIWFP